MKFIYQLKDPDTRMNFRLGRVHSNYDVELEKLFKAVCLIKDNHVEPALELIRLANRNHINQCAREELMDLCELIAVLWAQREYTGTLHSLEQGKVLHSIFELFGGYSFFCQNSRAFPNRPLEASRSSPYELAKDYPKLRVVLFLRSRWGNSLSRIHPINALLKSTFIESGLECSNLHTENEEDQKDLLTSKNCLIIFDIQAIGLMKSAGLAEKAKKSGNKSVAFFADFHYFETDENTNQCLKAFDIVWTSGTQSVDQLPYLDNLNRFTDFPAFTSFKLRNSFRPSFSKKLVGFIGSIERNNLPRIYYYITSLIEERYKFEISSHLDDGLSGEESYLQYLRSLDQYEILLSFNLRYTGARIISGRIGEVVALGKCLVSEYVPLLRRWFVPGVHYLEFSTPEELHVILDKLEQQKIDAKKIAQAAHSHASNNYSPSHLLRHFFSIA